MIAPDSSVEDVLAWEAQHRPRAGIAGLTAGVLTLGGTIVSALALRDRPSVTLFDALRDAGGSPPASGGLRVRTAEFIQSQAVALTLGQTLAALGGLLSAGVLVYLFLAARARIARLSQLGLGAAVAGGVLFFIGTIVPQVAVDVSTASFPRTTAGAHDALQPPAALVGALIGYVGTLALGIAFVITSLNAMRVGLLTRFMGILGIVSGALFVIPLASLPVVQAFWLMAVGAMILGRLPSGLSPAWQTGRAEPWPSRASMLAAQREAAAERAGPARQGERPELSEDGEDPGASAQPRSKKKKRRR